MQYIFLQILMILFAFWHGGSDGALLWPYEYVANDVFMIGQKKWQLRKAKIQNVYMISTLCVLAGLSCFMTHKFLEEQVLLCLLMILVNLVWYNLIYDIRLAYMLNKQWYWISPLIVMNPSSYLRGLGKRPGEKKAFICVFIIIGINCLLNIIL